MGKHTLNEPEPVQSGTWTEEQMEEFNNPQEGDK